MDDYEKYLFRGKEKDSGKWIYGDLRHISDGLGGYTLNIVDNTSGRNNDVTGVEVISETVGMFIMLTDKNGKKVFEGDIFKFSDEIWESSYTSCGTEWDSWKVENYAVVGFDDERSGFDFVKYKFCENSVEADFHENHDIEFAEFISNLEVIGNIYDNPELLGGENNGSR